MYRSIEQLKGLIGDFENGTLPRDEWNHAAHLAVALWYIDSYSEHEATRAFITGILRYNRANGIEATDSGGYNETLTLFWLTIARGFYDAATPGTDIVELTNDFIRSFGHKKALFREYYSEDLIWSWRARQSWTEPDLKPIEKEAAEHVE